MGKGAKGKNVPCRFFSSPQGCSNEACPFLHDSTAVAKGSKKGLSSVPCKFFASGRGCTNDNCPFLHGSANASFSNYSGAASKPASKLAGEDALKSSAPGDDVTGADTAPQSDVNGNCKFFGSARGCSNDSCPFSHANPNSVPPCSFKQRLGTCEKGDACTFRHVPWSSAEEARNHYAAREKGTVETSTKRFKQLHRDDEKEPQKLGKEHVEFEAITVERDAQVETYGSNAVRMMEKMGYKAGQGLGKDEKGSTKLLKPCLDLETASQKSALGFGKFSASGKATIAERAAHSAAARAQKVRRVDDAAFVVNNLLSDDESSDDDEHVKARDIQLAAR